MQYPTAEGERVNIARVRVIAHHRRQPAGQRIMKGPGFLRRTRLPAQPPLPERRQIQFSIAPRQRRRVINPFAGRRQRFQTARRFPLIAQGERGAAQRAGDGIKQPSARRRFGRIYAALNRSRQQRPVLLTQCGGCRIILPVRDKCQAVGEQIAPRLTRREVAAGQRHRRQPAKTLALAIVDPQAFAAPQLAVLPHPDTVEGQGNHVAAVQRPAMLGHAGGSVGMMMQHALHR